MKDGTTNWEKRARELINEWTQTGCGSFEKLMLQLGREMADEAFAQTVKSVSDKMQAAADARAEPDNPLQYGTAWKAGQCEKLPAQIDSDYLHSLYSAVKSIQHMLARHFGEMH